MMEHQPVCIWPAGAELGEGPLWHASSRSVYFVDIRARKVHRCAEDGSQRRSWDAPGQPGFIVPVAEGGFACALDDGLYRFSETTGQFSALRSVEADLTSNRFNDGFVDAQGCLWFGSMDAGETQPTGSLYRIDRYGNLTSADSGYIITNGPAISPDGKTLYHTDTLEKTVFAFDILPDGTLGGKRRFVTIMGSGYPDGMAVDADGNVWIALFGGWRIERYSPEGKRIGNIGFPCSNITKLAFGGDDLRTAYVTTAWKGLSDVQRAAEPLAGGLFTFRSDTPGLAQHEFSIQDFA
jgi:D-xylonolactonase